MMNTEAPGFHHIPVMLTPCLDALRLKPDGIYADATLGGAGHSSEIAKRLTAGGRLIGFDRDPEAIAAAGLRLSPYSERVTLVNRNYTEVKSVLTELNITALDGALMDLDAPLDMRMNQSDPLSAKEIVNTYPAEQLEAIIFTYGEERWAKRIVEFIVNARSQSPIETTGELVDIIKRAVPKNARRDGPHPAKRTFQAMRIEVNNELGGLQTALHDFIDVLAPHGRLAVITFHSLEDRIVKNILRERERGCTCPPECPVCTCGKKSAGRVITRKPILPTEAELNENPRARSAKLRIFEKRSEE